MHPGLTLEKRIAAEIASYDGKMAVYVNDLKGNIIEINVDEQFETASIKHLPLLLQIPVD